MRARRGLLLGVVLVSLYAAAMVAVAVQTAQRPDVHRPPPAAPADPVDEFIAAWERSREATFVASGTYERHSEVTGSTLSSEDVVAQRPPRRLHRALGGVDGRDDDRVIVCPAPPAGQEEAAPCQLGPPGGLRYDAAVAREVEGLRSVLAGPDPLYRVRRGRAGCFELAQRRIDPRAPFGVAASFCFDPATGAPSARRIRHEGGIVEVLTVTAIRSRVTDADLEP
jgi:hypothetical protein